MGLLEKIRNKTGLLVGIIGLALIIFILQSALETGNSLFGGTSRSVGKIAGKNIDQVDFQNKYTLLLKNMEENKQKVDDQARLMAVDQVWNDMITDLVLNVAYKKSAVGISDEELYDLMITHPHQIVVGQFTDRQSGKVLKDFSKPDGTIDPAKLQALVQQMDPNQEKFWKKVEEFVLQTRISEKYNTLLKKGLYVTRAEAKAEYNRQSTTYNAHFVAKRYGTVSDSAIKVSEQEVRDFYEKNSYKFQNFETNRKIDYVTFDAYATPEDISDLKKSMEDVANDFKKRKTLTEDSSLMQNENENGLVDIGMFKKSMISPEVDSSITTDPKGTVYGPFQENNLIKVIKLEEKLELHDSAKVRHILISFAGGGTGPEVKRSKPQAKSLADSLLALIKKDLPLFTKFVKDYSDDGGKKLPPNKKEGEDYLGKDGVYGWMNDNSGFVDGFKNFGLTGKKGELGVVETQFGYHIMDVMDISSGSQQKFKIATVSRKIQPSANTLNKFNNQANEFAGKYSTGDLFDKGVDEMKLNKRLADNVRENDKQIPGLDNPKDLIRWVYQAKKNDVSQAYQFGSRFVVAKLTDIKEKGTAPFEQVKEDVTLKLKQEKKGLDFSKEFTDFLNATKNADDLANRMKLHVEKVNDLSFNAYNVAGLGKEDPFCGAITVLKNNTPSKPVIGMGSVYVIWLDSKKDPLATKDYTATQKTANGSLAARVDYEANEALKNLANIEDHRAKFDF